ncbi:MAG: D-aminoacyl-tRNA deacylase [Christensenella sp.]|nr:D-aminoacyl-tRNA deacylase [Christensenella sp.]
MRAVVQRVKKASVSVSSEDIAEIHNGILILLGVSESDTEKDIDYIVEKCVNLRVFDDAQGVMNLSVADIGGEVLLVSQFTLYGDVRKGRRPSYTEAARPDAAAGLFAQAAAAFRQKYPKLQTGKFQAEMEVSLVNDGPVTILLDSKKFF